jgi:L-ascorbate metabolism protein UlaG (beta-lactamase superfamily)
MEPLELEGIKITPFDGLHREVDSTYPDGRRGVPAIGYLMEFSGKRWLFPGDTRTFDASQLPSFGPVDGLFAHLWLGRGCALNEKPPLLDAFCSFCLELQPKRIIVTHLEEFGRTIDEYWDEEHFQPVRRQILERAPDRIIESAYLGKRVDL